jgi:hypothetical protein
MSTTAATNARLTQPRRACESSNRLSSFRGCRDCRTKHIILARCRNLDRMDPAIDAPNVEFIMSHDEELKKWVLAELKWEPSILSSHIGVTAEGGTITLIGHVESHQDEANPPLIYSTSCS